MRSSAVTNSILRAVKGQLRVVVPYHAVTARTFSIVDELARKEKVEEDRYMRSLDAKFIAERRATLKAQIEREKMEIYKSTIAPLMAEAQSVLEKSGASSPGKNTLSPKSLEALARWKLGTS